MNRSDTGEIYAQGIDKFFKAMNRGANIGCILVIVVLLLAIALGFGAGYWYAQGN